MISYRTLLNSFLTLDLKQVPVIAHASLSSFGRVRGSADSVVGALIEAFAGVIMPTFTYKTMITPEKGPSNNGITYGSGRTKNLKAEFYHHDMCADPLMGIVAETFRIHPRAVRSAHPVYSFSGINADNAIKAQTLENPFGPIETLTDNGGWVLLIGVDQKANTSIHYGEQLVGRKQFIRWALTPKGILPCPRWPGCSKGFNQITPLLDPVIKTVKIGMAEILSFPLGDLKAVVKEMIIEDPYALLCDDIFCERCSEIRKSIP